MTPSFVSLLPLNASPLERVLERVVYEFIALGGDLRSLWSPQDCPTAFLAWLAWAVSVDVWNEAWPEATKRAVIASSIPMHRIKGTVAAVEKALEPLGLDTSIVEWWQATPAKAPGTFSVRVGYGGDGPTLDARLNADLRAAITRAKPVSRHFSLDVAMDSVGPLALAGAPRGLVRMSIPAGA